MPQGGWNKKYIKETDAELMELYRASGYNMTTAAASLGCAPNRLARIFDRRGIPRLRKKQNRNIDAARVKAKPGFKEYMRWCAHSGRVLKGPSDFRAVAELWFVENGFSCEK